MQIEILAHGAVLSVEHFDAKTKVATVKLFGVMHKYQEHEYEIIEEK